MPVEGLHPVLESTLNLLIAGNSLFTSWKMCSKFGTHTVTLQWKDMADNSSLDKNSSHSVAYRKKPPCQIRRDRERCNRRKGSKTDSGLPDENNSEKMSKSSIDFNYANEESLISDHNAWPSVTSTPGPWAAVHSSCLGNEMVTCMKQPSVQQCKQTQFINSACGQAFKNSAFSLQSSAYLDCSKPIHFSTMETLSADYEMKETVQEFPPDCQESCDISDPNELEVSLSNLVDIAEPANWCKDLGHKYWKPGPGEDPYLIMTCMNCDLVVEDKMCYECEQCFNYFCEHCYTSGVHQEHDDSLSIQFKIGITLDDSVSSSDSESERLESSYCSTDENSLLIHLGIT